MRSLYGFIFFLITGILPLPGQIADSVKYQSPDPYYFHLEYLKHDPALILDVRMRFEFNGRRLKDAINVPSPRELDALTDTLSKDYYLFLYCTDGYRSKNAAELLYDKGFRRLYNLEGGIVAWRKEGMPIVKGRVKRKKSG
jgi:rhodanese-related sulfurtransferase